METKDCYALVGILGVDSFPQMNFVCTLTTDSAPDSAPDSLDGLSDPHADPPTCPILRVG